MKNTCCVTLTLALGLMAGTAQAFSLGDAARLTTAIAAPESSAARTAELVTRLTDLNVSSEQAVGGTTALLELARNRLASADYSQLLQSVPALQGLTESGLTGQVAAVSGLLGKSNPLAKQQPAAAAEMHNLADVAGHFSNLGMETGKVNEFTPVLLQFLGSQGTSQPLLDSLSTIWTTPTVSL